MMGHARPLLGSWLGRADVHAPVQGHRIQRNDLGADPPRQFHAHASLAGTGWTGEKPAVEDTWCGHVALDC